MTPRFAAVWKRIADVAPVAALVARQHKELRRLNSELIAAVEDGEMAAGRVLDMEAQVERAERRAVEAERIADDLRGQLASWLDERVRGAGPAEGE